MEVMCLGQAVNQVSLVYRIRDCWHSRTAIQIYRQKKIHAQVPKENKKKRKHETGVSSGREHTNESQWTEKLRGAFVYFHLFYKEQRDKRKANKVLLKRRKVHE